LGMQPKMGGKFHLKLNTGTRPIANKYCEGKMKSTLKRELKARETVKREPIEASSAGWAISLRPPGRPVAAPAQAGRGGRGRGRQVHLSGLAGQHQFGLRERAPGKVAAFGRRYRPGGGERGRD